MAKVLVTGHTGMLGQALISELMNSTSHQVVGLSRGESMGLEGRLTQIRMDLCQPKEVAALLRRVRPDIIIHAAALTNIAQCESNIRAAHVLHVEATKAIASATSARVIYVSTDSVFGCNAGDYTEDDPVFPLNYYAFSKYQGELAVLGGSESNLVVRTNLYGFRRPLSSSLAEWAVKTWASGEPVNGFRNVVFNPLYAGQLAKALVQLTISQYSGILHVGCSDYCSKQEFLKRLAMKLGHEDEKVSAVDYEELQRLRRPLNTTLNTSRMMTVLGWVPDLESGLKSFVDDYRK